MKSVNENNVPYTLLAKYFAGECIESELEQLKEWLDSDPDNKQLFMEMKTCWSASSVKMDTISKSRSRTWRKLLDKYNRRLGFNWSAAAAVAAFLLLVPTFFLGKHFSGDMPEEQLIYVQTQMGQKAEITLPDDTHVWLNSGTKISYLADYNITNRKVTLHEGEAFFDVTHSDEHKFLLGTADGVAVQVHGTEFDVRSYHDDTDVDIVLLDGKVDVLGTDSNKLVELKPGEICTWKKDGSGFVVGKCEADEESVWRFGELRIDRLPLTKVVSLMEKWYGVDIKLTGACDESVLYWMTIKTESLREMLSLLCEITPIEYKIQGDEIIITLI